MGPITTGLRRPSRIALSNSLEYLSEHIATRDCLPARICRNGTRLPASWDLIVAAWP